jgi:hypothetical protein
MSQPTGTSYQSVNIYGAWRQKDCYSSKRLCRWKRYSNNAVGAKNWAIVGSNDNSTWFLIARVSNSNTNNVYIDQFVPSSYNVFSYRYIRWIEEAMVTSSNYILNHWFGMYDENGSNLTGDGAFTYSNNSGDRIGTDNSSSFWCDFGTYNWQNSGNYTSGGVYSGSTVTVVYDPTQPITTAPPAPTSLSASAGNLQAVVSFTQSSDGGSSITNYQYSIDDGATFTAFSPEQTSSPVTITGLMNGTSYLIQLKAVNSQGAGDPSSSVSVTPSTTPDAPTDLVASYNGSGSVSISFTSGYDEGAEITNYQYSIDGGDTFTDLSPVDSASPIVISGLTNGMYYIIELKGINANGPGTASSSVGYTASGLPDAPTSISWVDLYNGTISVSFTAGYDQGSSITNYSYSIDGGATFTALSPSDATSPILITGLSERTHYTLVLKAVNANGDGTASEPLALYYMCFLEGTKITCYDPVEQKEVERVIETLSKGDLVKTTMDGYKAIDTIGTSKIYNPANSMRSKNRLYRCSKENYPELTEDLVITGCHAVLVNELTNEQRKELLDIQGKIYATEDYYRLIACVDKRAVPYEKEGLFNIWHLALENDNYYFNYGIFANGLKVETASKRMMREMSGMDLKQ